MNCHLGGAIPHTGGSQKRASGAASAKYSREKVIKIKDRKRQRLNRRLKHKEELLDNKNDLGVKDLTAYNAVKQMVTNGKASIVWR